MDNDSTRQRTDDWGFREDDDGYLAFFPADPTLEPVHLDRHLADLRIQIANLGNQVV